MAKKLVIQVEAKDQVSSPVRKMVAGVLNFGKSILRVDKLVVGGVKRMTRALFSLKGALVGLVGIVAIMRLARSFNQATIELDRLAKTARTLDLKTEEYAKLELAAELAGVETERFTNLYVRMAAEIGKAATGTQFATARRAMKRLEEAGADLSLTGTERFASFAKALNSITDESERLAVAADLVGTRGAQSFVRLAKGMGDSLEVAGRFSGITDVQTAAAEKYQDSITLLSRAWLLFRANIIGVVGPAIADLVVGMAEATKRTGEFVAAIMRMVRQAFGSGEEGRHARMFIERLQGNLMDLVATMVKHLVKMGVTTFVELLPTAATIIASQAGGAIAKAIIGAYASALRGTVSVLQASVAIQNPLIGKLTENITEAADAAITAMEATTKAGVTVTVKQLSDLDKEMEGISNKLKGQTVSAIADLNRSWGELNVTLEQTKRAFGETDGGSIFRLEGLKPALESASQQMAQFRDNFRQMTEVGQNRKSLHGFMSGLESILPNTTRQMGEFGAKLKAAMGPEAARSIQSSASALAMIFRLMNTPPKLGWLDGLKFGFAEFQAAAENGFENARNMAFVTADAITTGITSAIWDAIEGVKSLKEAFKDFARNTLRLIGEMITRALIARAVGAIVGSFAAPAAAEGGTFWWQTTPPPGGMHGGMVDTNGIHRFAGGGMVPGPDVKRDIVPAILMPGEFVMRRQAAQKIGYGELQRANRSGQMPQSGPVVNQTNNINISGPVGDGDIAKLQKALGSAGDRLLAELARRPQLRDQLRGHLGA